MAIGDLLAQISGDKPATKPAGPKPSIASRPPPLKRRAEDGVENGMTRTAKVAVGNTTLSPTQVSPAPPKPMIERRPTQPQSTPVPSRTAQPSSRLPGSGMSSTAVSRTTASTQSSLNRVQSGRIAKPSGPASGVHGRNGGSTAAPLSSAGAPSAPPKKKSFAEIMARAERAQQEMGPIGGIRHKPIEVVKMDKHERPSDGRPSSSKPGSGGQNGQLKRSNTLPKVPSRNGTPAPGAASKNGSTNVTAAAAASAARHGRNGARAPPPPPPEPEKKFRRAAVATTGYTGTARPVAAAATKGRPADVQERAGLVNRHAARRPASRYREDEDEDDEELDDFIEYDDDDEDPAPRRYNDYDSDGSSDMEAGLDDIDDEEDRAARVAREEDRREEEALRRAKMLKERRKMQLMGRA
jgi:protein SPT2